MKTYSLKDIIKFSDSYNIPVKVIVVRNTYTDDYFLTNLSTNNISKRFDSNIVMEILKMSREDLYEKWDVFHLNEI